MKTKITLWALVVLLGVNFALNVSATASVVNWGAQIDDGIGDSSGNLLPIGSLVLLGGFDVSNAVIASSITSSASLKTLLSTHFTLFGSSTIGANMDIPGYWADTAVGNANTSTPFALNGKAIYIVAFNAPTVAAATQIGIFTSSFSSWIFPNDYSFPFNTTSIDLDEASHTPVYGGYRGGTFPLFTLGLQLSPSISGTVKNNANAAISGAAVSVVVSGITYSATTNSDGTYAIGNVPAGTDYIVTASVTGYESETLPGVTVTAGNTTFVNFTLVVTFASWAATHPGIGPPTADPDNDGILNVQEYAFNLNPSAPDRSGLPVVGTTTVSGSQYLTLTYTKQTLTGDLTYSIQSSPDLATWSPLTPVAVSTVDNGNGTQTVMVRDPVALDAGTRRFLRVVVVQSLIFF